MQLNSGSQNDAGKAPVVNKALLETQVTENGILVFLNHLWIDLPIAGMKKMN